jgi:hypothetical protein
MLGDNHPAPPKFSPFKTFHVDAEVTEKSFDA